MQKSMKRKSSLRRGVRDEKMDQTGDVLFSRQDETVDVSKFKLEDYKIVRHVGRGTFGKVYLVKNTHTNKYFAMKSIRKDVVI